MPKAFDSGFRERVRAMFVLQFFLVVVVLFCWVSALQELLKRDLVRCIAIILLSMVFLIPLLVTVLMK